jgi:hypothetical protein
VQQQLAPMPDEQPKILQSIGVGSQQSSQMIEAALNELLCILLQAKVLKV